MRSSSRYNSRSNGINYKRWNYEHYLRRRIQRKDVSGAPSLETCAFLDPNGNGAGTDWDVFDYTNVDDGVRAPTTPTGGSGDRCEYVTPAEPGDVEWTVEDTPANPGSTAILYRVWIYDDSGTDDVTSVNCKVNGVWQSSNFGPDGSNGGWDYYDFVVSEDMTNPLTDNAISCSADGFAETFYVDAAYIEVCCEENAGGSINPAFIFFEF